MTRRVAAAAVAVALAVLLLAGPSAVAAPAQDGTDATATSSTTSTVVELPPAEMIPRPNSGHQPVDSGDRGGSLQLLVFVVVLLALAGGVAKAVLDSRRARARSAGDPES